MGILDLVMTVCVLSFTEAGEANPLMAHFLSFGLAWLITAKLASLFIPLGFLEFARRRRPAFVQKASIAGIGAYAVLLLAGMAHFNTPNTDLRDLDDSLRIKLAASLREKAQRKAQTFVLQRLHTIRHFGPGAAFYNEVSEEATRPEG